MHPVWVTVTFFSSRLATSSKKAASTGRAPAAIPQVAMPTTTRMLSSLFSRTSICFCIFSRMAFSSSRLFKSNSLL